jgi:DNA-binding response OmpR family regulator
LAKIPVIVATARDDDETIKLATRMGASNYLIKPYTPFEILDAIKIVAPQR